MPLNAGSGSSRMPVLVVTGFLGSGKTTLLRKALRDKRFAVRFECLAFGAHLLQLLAQGSELARQ